MMQFDMAQTKAGNQPNAAAVFACAASILITIALNVLALGALLILAVSISLLIVRLLTRTKPHAERT